MPICKGPSEWVDGRLNVQRLGASKTLTGIRNLLQVLEICVLVAKLSPSIRLDNSLVGARTYLKTPCPP